ncbi:hypothetical protein ACI784_20365 [Geodermatophilus sp. SYSU D01186]
MLSDQERRVWDDVERFWAEEAVEPRPAPPPRRRGPRGLDDGCAAAVVVLWLAILLVLLGVPAVAVALAVATAVAWVLWRYWPRLGERGSASTWSVPGEISGGAQAARRPGDRSGRSDT